MEAGIWIRLTMKDFVSLKQLRQFGFLIGFGFPIIIGLLIPLISGHLFKSWTLWIGIPSLIFGILNPRLLLYPYKCWMKLGYFLGWINSRIILGLIFLIVLQPISLIMKFFNYDPLRMKKSNSKSYRQEIKNKRIDLNRIF